MAPVPTTLGIDLGTTNSSCAFYDGREVVVIPNERGSRTTPSVVAISRSGEILVGESARNQAVLHPDRTIRHAKRLMGQSGLLAFGEKKIRAEEAGSYVLARLKADAEAFLGDEVADAVITVPAYFSEAQRRATREAGALAGLRVRRLLNEPTAAAIAWAWSNNRNYGEDGEERRVLVYDLGGGTFDSTLLSMRGGDCTVLAASGDNSLGGLDFDALLLERAIEAFEAQLGKGSVGSDPVLGQQLFELVERAKMELSVRETANVTLPFVGAARGEHPSWLVRRGDFEEMITPLIDRTMEIVSRTIAEAGAGGVDRLVLSGGSSRIPLVRRRLTELLGKEAETRVNPEEIVSFGAAVFASLSGATPAADGFRVRDAVSRTFGVEIDGDDFIPLIAKNTPIPVTRSRAFTTVADGQSTVEIHVLQGESKKASENLSLGRFLLTGIRDGKRGEPRIELEFSIDPDEILHVRAHDVDTGVAHAVVIASAPDGARKPSADRLVSLAARARDLAEAAAGDRSLEAELRQTAEEADLVARDAAAFSGAAVPEVLSKRAEAATWALEVLIAELESRKPVGG